MFGTGRLQQFFCSAQRLNERFEWKMRLILCLANEPKHFNEIRKCHGVSPRILSKELKELELNGILIRAELNDNLKSVVYSLTEQGVELVPIILQLQKWGAQHRESILRAMNVVED
jgi:DNA-binding HxlR family transcriptional regulator